MEEMGTKTVQYVHDLFLAGYFEQDRRSLRMGGRGFGGPRPGVVTICF